MQRMVWRLSIMAENYKEWFVEAILDYEGNKMWAKPILIGVLLLSFYTFMACVYTTCPAYNPDEALGRTVFYIVMGLAFYAGATRY